MWQNLDEILRWMVFLLFLIIVVRLLIYLMQGKRKIIAFMALLIFGGAFIYSFFTEEGSVRLSLVFSGHPIYAYTTPLKKDETNHENNSVYYEPTKEMTFLDEVTKVNRCKSYGPIKITIPIRES